MPPQQPSRLSGQQAENMACDYLLKRGMTLVERNFRTRRGEIDLIMYDRQVLGFVEVKYRHSNRFGSAEEAINRAKLTRLRAAASAFLQQRQPSSQAFRLDALTLVPLLDSRHSYRYNWIKKYLAVTTASSAQRLDRYDTRPPDISFF
jgi:putative endonuclease